MENQPIKTLRKELGLSQRQLAKRLGVSKRAVAYWESGKTSPGEEMLSKLAELQVTSDEEMNNESVTSGEEVKNGEEENSKSVKNDEEVNSKSVKNGEEVKSKSVKNGEEVNSESVKNDEEVNSKSVKNGEEVNSESVKSGEEVNSKSVKNGEEVKSKSVKNDEEVNNDENVTNDEKETNQTHGFDTQAEVAPNEAISQPKGSAVYNTPSVLNQDTLSPEAENPSPKKRKAFKRRSPFVQSVLDKIPIEGEIGKDVQLRHSGKKFSGLCPFHNDTNPSFEVYPQTQSWFCYGCQKGGSLIDYVMYRDSLTPAEAIRRLCETYSIPQPSWTEKEKEEWVQAKEEKELISEINLAVFKWYHGKMPPERREYYLQRGITDDTINKELLGYAPDKDAIVGELLKTYKPEQLVSSGLFTVVSGCLEPIYKRRYVIPYWEDGKIVYSIGRLDTDDPDEIAQLPEWNRGKYKKQLVHSKRGSATALSTEKHPEVSKVVKNVIWNADCVGDYSVGSIAEGIIDGILHKQISEEIGLQPDGDPAGVGVISPVTTKFSNNDLKQLVNLTEPWEKVYCIFDNEVSRAGIKGAVKTAKTLFKAGRNPHIVLPPRPDDVEKVDLADYLNVPSDQKEARKKEFEQLLSSSPPLLDYLIKEAKEIQDKKARNEAITEIISLMVDINPLELEDYKETLEEELGLKSRVFNKLYKEAEKEKAREVRYRDTGRKKAQDKINAINVEHEKPQDDTTPRRYGDVLETEEGYAQVTVNPAVGLQLENISSFLIKPKSRLWIDDYEAVSTDFVTKEGKTYSTIIERHHWNELKLFMGRLPSIDLVWQGKLPEVQAVMGIVKSYEVPVQKGTRQIGWYNTGTEAEPKLIWVAKDINIAKEGFLQTPEVIYCPYTGEMEIENAISFRECDDVTFQQQCSLAKELVLINEPNAILPIIGWFFAVPFKWYFMNHPNYHHFPHLNVWGTRGSGKTETVKLLWRIFGYTGKEIPSASQTRFALLRMFTSTNSYPICLDEYKPYDMKAGSPEAVGHFMRLAYDGKVDARGRPDQSIVSYRLIAPACLIGENPLEETAILERIIPSVLSPSAIDKQKEEGKERQSIFSKLNETNWEGFFMRYLRYVMNIGLGEDFTQVHDGARGRVLYYLKMRPLVPRILDNLVALQFGLERFAEFLGIPFDAIDGLMQECIINTANTLCGEGDVHSKLAAESMLEQLSIMAETGRIRHGIHYVVNEKDSRGKFDTATPATEKEIYLRLSACLAEFRKFVRETNWQGEVMVDAAYKRQLREMMDEGKLVIDTSRATRGWNVDKPQRAVVIVPSDTLDLSGFQERTLWGPQTEP